MLSQNAPFTPVFDAWRKDRREFPELDPVLGRASAEKIVASVLSNQRPPYSIAGGIFDVLRESRGDMMAVRNDEVLEAMRLFERCEGIDIEPAAGVALASLTTAARSGQIGPGSSVLLHITGGGSGLRESEKSLCPAPADVEISLPEVSKDAALENACSLFPDQEFSRPSVRNSNV